MPKIMIALATYQGAAFVRSQIASIRRQSLEDWTLLVRDDGSTDATVEIVREMAARDRRIHLLQDERMHCGSAGNFAVLLQRAYDLGADYVFLADQDDVWLADKLRRQMDLLRHNEIAGGRRTPHLVYSDLVVVDRQLRTVHPSFFSHSRLRHGGPQPLRTFLGRSVVLGCASALNRPLLELALPLPASVPWHDWWIALCAAAVGSISCLPQPMLWYRRHGANSSGPAGFWAGFNPWRYDWGKRWASGYDLFRQSLTQAMALRSRLQERPVTVSEETQAYLERFCAVFEHPQPAWRRIGQLLSMGIPAIDVPRRLLYYLCVSALPRQERIALPPPALAEPVARKAA